MLPFQKKKIAVRPVYKIHVHQTLHLVVYHGQTLSSWTRQSVMAFLFDRYNSISTNMYNLLKPDITTYRRNKPASS